MLSDYTQKNDNDRLTQFIDTLSMTNRTPEYYINWNKVKANTKKFELELNTLNYLVGRDNIDEEARALFLKQPDLLRVFPSLIATRDEKLDILVLDDDYSLESMRFHSLDFKNIDITKIDEYMEFLDKAGILDFIQGSANKNLVDFMYGVEAGLDSNGRKNRSGTIMENILGATLESICKDNDLEFKTQATSSWIADNWGIDVPVDKSKRRFDGAVYDDSRKKVWVIEINYYGGGGSKLKSVSGEFRTLNGWVEKAESDVQFVWISDGQGWHTAIHPMEEAFETIPYIFNLSMVKEGYLRELIES